MSIILALRYGWRATGGEPAGHLDGFWFDGQVKVNYCGLREVFKAQDIIVRHKRPLRILFLLGISVLLFALVLYVDYRYGLRENPEILSNQRKTEHFHIYTNLDPDSLGYYEHFFEGFFDYFNREFFEIGQKRRLKVYLFKDTASYRPYAESVREYYTPYGFYMGPWSNIIVVNKDSGLGTTTHELVHHFIATSFVEEPPRWVDEGIATFFEKFIGHFDSEGKLTISFGYFSNWRFPITKSSVEKLSLESQFAAVEPDQCAVRSLMLFLHKKGLFKKFVREMQIQTDDPAGVRTLQKVYGRDIRQIERDWKKWIRSQPIDGDVNMVPSAFVKTEKEWRKWWKENRDRLYWSRKEQIYRIRD